MLECTEEQFVAMAKIVGDPALTVHEAELAMIECIVGRDTVRAIVLRSWCSRFVAVLDAAKAGA